MTENPNALRPSKAARRGHRLTGSTGLLALATLILGCGDAEAQPAAPPFAQVKLAMFSDAACSQPLRQNGQPFVVTMDTSKACFAFNYTDPAGLVVPTSHANFRCTSTGVSYDKFPFNASCQPSTTRSVMPTIGYTVTSACQFAPSHGGGVYERLVDYTYPGASGCAVTR